MLIHNSFKTFQPLYTILAPFFIVVLLFEQPSFGFPFHLSWYPHLACNAALCRWSFIGADGMKPLLL